MRRWLKPTPPPDDPLAFRWWTFGVLVFYTGALLVLCGFVTLHKSASASPPHLPIAIAKIANIGVSGAGARTLCYQVVD